MAKRTKNADIVPIFKAGDRYCMSDYRPFSFISNLANIFEKIICSRFYMLLTECKIVSDNQFGFVKNRGTTEALHYVCNIIYNSINKKSLLSLPS